MTYLDQMCTKLLNLADNYYWQYYNVLILLQCIPDQEHFHNFFFILLLVFLSNFIVSGVKSSR